MSSDVRARLRIAAADGRAAPLEFALADWALRHGATTAVALAFAACARAVADGHSCLLLEAADIAVPGEAPPCNHEALVAALDDSDLVGVPGDARPMIMEAGRLYLERYWDYEQRLAARLRALLAAPPQPVNIAALQPAAGLFDFDWVGEQETNWQAVAGLVAARHRFAVISGGPGTGKTYTVLRLMRLLIERALAAGQTAPVIRLAAPTGKAAARMLASVHSQLDALALPDAVRAHIPGEAKTLHRLVGIGRNTTRPRHDRDNPLAADVVIVDEASMIDLPMMAKLLDALPGAARLVLLGDRYQLASVESGSVLAEICNAAGVNAFTTAQQDAAGALLRNRLESAENPLADHVVTLQSSHRFSAHSPIGRLAAAINAGDTDATLAILGEDVPEIEHVADTGPQALQTLIAATAQQYLALRDVDDPTTALAGLQAHCLLCALRRGPRGSATLNRRVATQIAQMAGTDPDARWYHGRPVIITRNDYRAGLYNGDIGICLVSEEGQLRVWFATEGGPRAFQPTALPEHESAYAMTVHKSQGSEFDRVTLVLPEDDAPVLTRELLYTGITRARDSVRLCAQASTLRAAVARVTRRYSGLGAKINAAS